jgi:hypothetical protein
MFATDKSLQDHLRQAYFTGDIDGVIKLIDQLNPSPQR